ncbi:MAG: hypothetical protein ACI9CO_000593 [Candidatus Azotimanducaceae bacterium]|jgi:hypothetical protein
MKKIKLLHFVHSLVSGGAEKQLRLLSDGLDKRKFEVAIFCVDDTGNDIADKRVEIRTPKTRKVTTLSYFNSIYRVVKEFDPDVVHVWLPASVSIPTMIVCRLLDKKVIFSYRNKMHFHRPLSYPRFLVAVACANRIVGNHENVDSHPFFKWLYRQNLGRVINNTVVVPREGFITSRHEA